MSITINDGTGRELEINLNTLPSRFSVGGLHTEEERENYQGPLGDVYFRDGEEHTGAPGVHTAFENLTDDVQKELTEIATEAQKLMERARGLALV